MLIFIQIVARRIIMHPLLNLAITAARQAGEIIVRNLELLDRIKIQIKNSNEFFSEVDVKAEQAIIRTILKAYPHHGILAEESGGANLDAETVWIIDPLDGTTNYLHSYPYFAVSIACKINNRIEHAVIFDPMRHEYFTASRGQGAKLNEHRIRVSKQTLFNMALIGTGLPAHDPALAKHYLPIFDSLIGQCKGIRRSGSAALDLAYVACGRIDGLIEFGLRSWDMAAGSLLIKEAGGFISDPHGGEDFLNKGNVVAGSIKVFKKLLQVVQPIIS